MKDAPLVQDVPYSSLLDPGSRIAFPGRRALPETPGLYAWWETSDGGPGTTVFGEVSRPVYLAAARNLAASIEADATGIRTSLFRRKVATALTDRLQLRRNPVSGGRPPLNKDENTRLSNWVATRMQVSWSEIAEPEPYRQALARALDPHLPT